MRRRKRFIQSGRTYRNSTPDENLQAGRAGAVEQDPALFNVNECAPLVPKELHELARHISIRYVDHEEDFITFDYHLCRLSHARSLIDLCLGELLSAFRKNDGKAYGEMGYSKLDDFADEHLSFSGRLASEMILNFERLQALPLTREAYIKGDIVKSALRMLLRVMTKENEAALLSEINGLSVGKIDRLVREKLKTAKVCNGLENAAGGDAERDAMRKTDAAESISTEAEASGSTLPTEEQDSEEILSEEADREEGSGVVMKFSVPRTLALTWDFALEHYRENEKTKGPLYGFVEALVSSFLDSTADLAASQEYVSDAELTDAAEPECVAEPEAEAGVDADAYSEACSGNCIDLDGETGEASLHGPAFAGKREVPLLYNDAIWDSFPSEREMRAHNRDDSLTSSETGVAGAAGAGAGDCGAAGAGAGDCRAAGAGDCRAAGSGCAKPDEAGDEYPDPQNEERLKQIREELALKPFVVELPEEYSQIPSDSYALAQKIIRVASMRQSIDYHIGWFLKAVHDRRLYRIMEFSKIEDYAKVRINISASTTFRLIKLVRYFKNHPVIEKAFLSRKITREQAYQIASLEDGRHERIWLDFAMSRPARELREEVNRILRIKQYDYFASHYYALLPGFRYVTDDRYNELSFEMKDILRTGAWYKGPGSEWPLSSHDEHLLDKDFTDRIADTMESSATGLSKCTADILEEMEQTGAVQLSKCAADLGRESDLEESSQLSKCASNIESAACLSREEDRHHSDETLEQARELCTLPDKHRPAMTLLLDVLESMERQSEGKGSCAAAASAGTAAAPALPFNSSAVPSTHLPA